MSDEDFKLAIEAIKLRAPIEDVVRERLPGLRKSGALWEACCPFHEERTPSFKVNPGRGTWHCFGACSAGGDVISFLERLDHLNFMEVLEILSARTGVELPRKQGAAARRGDDRGFEALSVADGFYQHSLRTAEGRRALDYLRQRGLGDNTLEAFGVGYAPADRQSLVRLAREDRRGPEAFVKAGLVRVNDSGRHYDFFGGRLIIPIRDIKGRTVGFGARRLEEGPKAGPKYINSAESDYFHKGQLIYGLDRCLDKVRRGGHLVLVEGYTDVMAAHQVGLSHVAAVLGTSTTEQHAALVRRAGARKVSLVFDGDAAGREAAFRALGGLLPLGLELEVVSLPEGMDPCDLLIKQGSEPFLACLEMGATWFDFLIEGFKTADGGSLTGADLAREVDRVLGLLLRLPKAVHRESLVGELAQRLHLSVEAVQEQWNQLPERRRLRSQQQRNSGGWGSPVGAGRTNTAVVGARPRGEHYGQGHPQQGLSQQGQSQPGQPQRAHPRSGQAASNWQAAPVPTSPTQAGMPAQMPSGSQGIGQDPLAGRLAQPNVAPQYGIGLGPAAAPVANPLHICAFEDMVGAALLDPGLVPLLGQQAEACPDAELGRVIRALLALYEDEDADIDDTNLMNSLGMDPARERVVPCAQRARTAESPLTLFESARDYLQVQALDLEKRQCMATISQIERGPFAEASENVQLLDQVRTRLNEIHRSGRSPQAS